MLGVESYQEALRAIGSLARRDIRLAEQPAVAAIQLHIDGRPSRIAAAQLLDLIDASRARRGSPTSAGNVSDVLRSIGLALDELGAREIELVLCADSLDVSFSSTSGARHDLSYAGDELEALRRAAAARRTGQPMRRVLILHSDARAAAPLRELLLAEFAVMELPATYARAVAEAGPPPDAVVADAGAASQPTLDALRALRASPRTADVPIMVISSPEADLDPAEAFACGADDLLPTPYAPAQLRARLRTWLLRRSA
jgi:CheY-like chemotaxis protein